MLLDEIGSGRSGKGEKDPSRGRCEPTFGEREQGRYFQGWHHEGREERYLGCTLVPTPKVYLEESTRPEDLLEFLPVLVGHVQPAQPGAPGGRHWEYTPLPRSVPGQGSLPAGGGPFSWKGRWKQARRS